MPGQRVLIFSVGGPLADAIWGDMVRWNAALDKIEVEGDGDGSEGRSDVPWHDLQALERLAAPVRQEIDAFVDRLDALAYTPPILYRAEHVDCWSMGDTYYMAMSPVDPDQWREAGGCRCDVLATWRDHKERLIVPRTGAHEVRWLHQHINEAAAAWGVFAERRLILLVRSIFSGLWSDDEVRKSLESLPEWWTAEGLPLERPYSHRGPFIERLPDSSAQ